MSEPHTYVSVSFPSLPATEAARLVETVVSLAPGRSVNVFYGEADTVTDDDAPGEL